MTTTLHKHDSENCMLTKAHLIHTIMVQVINGVNMCCLPPILTISQPSSQIRHARSRRVDFIAGEGSLRQHA